MPATPEQIAKLSGKTPKSEIKWRKGPRGLQLAYIDARYTFDTLDKHLGPHNWATDFREILAGRLIGGIGILTEDGWVWKWDTGEESDIEPGKGLFSDSLKRAGVHWGIGRDLYSLKPKRERAPKGEPDTNSKPAPDVVGKTGLSDQERRKLFGLIKSAGWSRKRKSAVFLMTSKNSVKQMNGEDLARVEAIVNYRLLVQSGGSPEPIVDYEAVLENIDLVEADVDAE